VTSTGGPGAGHQDGAHQDLHEADDTGDVEGVGHHCGDPSLKHLVYAAEFFLVLVQDVEGGPQAVEGAGGVGPQDARAQDGDPGRRDAGDAAQQDAPSAPVALQEGRRQLRRHPPGHFAHRPQHGQRAVVLFYRLVGNGRDSPVQHHLDSLPTGRRQVEKAADNLPFVGPLQFLAGGADGLQHHIGAPVDLLGGVGDAAPGPLVVVIRKARALTGPFLHVADVASAGEQVHPVGGQPDPHLQFSSFFRNADNHTKLLSCIAGTSHPETQRHEVALHRW
jgi:hypothetical protein